MKLLCAALGKNTSITSLNLDQNQLKCVDPSLSNYLATNTTLQELSLSANKILNEGIAGLAGFLEPNSTLTYIDLSKNNFGDAGFEVFAT